MSNGKIIPIMPEAMGIYELEKNIHLNNKEIIYGIIEKASSNLKRNSRAGSPLYHICSRKDQNIFKAFPALTELYKEVIRSSLSYLKSTGYLCEEVVIPDAWLNIGPKDSILHWHSHGNAFLSGTYYVNFDPNEHSMLEFKNDRMDKGQYNRPTISIPTNKKVNSPYTNPSLRLSVPEGSILIWKSHLIHGYHTPNKTDDRITLSFNVMPKECTDGQTFSFSVADD
tara:strand:- start:341 stop:1018 length:678 start_codon:yes stop_codon:yes gene_type:complete